MVLRGTNDSSCAVLLRNDSVVVILCCERSKTVLVCSAAAYLRVTLVSDSSHRIVQIHTQIITNVAQRMSNNKNGGVDRTVIHLASNGPHLALHQFHFSTVGRHIQRLR